MTSMIGMWNSLYRQFRFSRTRFPQIENWTAANDDWWDNDTPIG